MALGYKKRAVGTFATRREAELALRELKNSGFSMDNVSIIARDVNSGEKIADVDVEDRKKVGNKSDEGASTGAVTGGVLGGLTGLLVGLGALAIPGIGPIMLAGAEATALATTLAGTAIGAATGGLIGALIGLGIPEERAKTYNDRVTRGEYLVIVDGTEADLVRAQSILSQHGIQDWGIYDIPAAKNTATSTTPMAATTGMNPEIRQSAVSTSTTTTTTTATTRPGEVKAIDTDGDKEPEIIIVDNRK